MDEKLIEKGLDITDQIINGLKEAAPQMAELTLAAVRLDAVISLAITVVLLLSSIGISIFFITSLKKAFSENWDQSKWACIAFSTGFVDLVVVISTIVFLVDRYMWAALVDPRIALAMRALDKVLTTTNTK